jgi:hypothetical protein
MNWRGRQTHFLLPVFLERRESVERVRELESRGERGREREREKTVAEGEKVFGASDELTTKRQYQQTW